MFVRVAFVGFVVSLASVVGAQSPEQPPVDVELAARSFRIQLYMTHQHDRDAYLRGRAASEEAFRSWKKAGSPAPDAMARWYRDARHSIVQGAQLPPTPAFPAQLVTEGDVATPNSKRSRRRNRVPAADVATEAPNPTQSVLATEPATQPEPNTTAHSKETKPEVAATQSQTATVRAKASDMLRALWDVVSPEATPTSEPEPTPPATVDEIAPIESESGEPTEPAPVVEPSSTEAPKAEEPTTEAPSEPAAQPAEAATEQSTGETPAEVETPPAASVTPAE